MRVMVFSNAFCSAAGAVAAGRGRSTIFFAKTATVLAAKAADAGSYTPHGTSQCASAVSIGNQRESVVNIARTSFKVFTLLYTAFFEFALGRAHDHFHLFQVGRFGQDPERAFRRRERQPALGRVKP